VLNTWNWYHSPVLIRPANNTYLEVPPNSSFIKVHTYLMHHFKVYVKSAVFIWSLDYFCCWVRWLTDRHSHGNWTLCSSFWIVTLCGLASRLATFRRKILPPFLALKRWYLHKSTRPYSPDDKHWHRHSRENLSFVRSSFGSGGGNNNNNNNNFMIQDIFSKLYSFAGGQQITWFYLTQMFITVFTKARL
jgi:hypothetical protein